MTEQSQVPPGYGPPGYAPPGIPLAGPVQPGYPYPQSSYPVPRPPRGAITPARFEVVEGTDFGVAYLHVPPLASGQGIGSLVAGIVSIVVTLIAVCLGLIGSRDGWGALVSGAFAILAVLVGGAAIVIGVVAGRTIRRSDGTVTGRGMARGGMVCGIVGVSLAVLGFVGTLVATYLAG